MNFFGIPDFDLFCVTVLLLIYPGIRVLLAKSNHSLRLERIVGAAFVAPGAKLALAKN